MYACVGAIIYPKEETEGEEINDYIKKSINPAKLKVGIKRLQKVNKGGMFMEVNTKEYENNENEVISNEKLKENCIKTEKQWPIIIIYGTNEKLQVSK